MQWWCSAQGVAWTWAWRPYPGVWVFVLVLAAAYTLLLRATADRATGPPDRARIGSFAAGLLILWVALDWPVGALGGGYLASVHMVQFLLIALAAPPLLLYGIPPAAYDPLRRRPGMLAALRGATHPFVALGLFNVFVVATHVPAVVDALMTSQLGSFTIDMAWLGAGLLFWWPVATPVPRRAGFREMVKVGYLAVQTLAMTPLFVWLTFSEFPLYATFELAPRVAGISARVDQQTAGLLMKTGGMIIMLTAVGVLFLRWISSAEEEAANAPSAREPADRLTAAGP